MERKDPAPRNESEQASGGWRPTKRQTLWAVGLVVALLATSVLIFDLYPGIWRSLSEKRTLMFVALGVSLTAIVVLLAIGGAASSWTGFLGKTIWDIRTWPGPSCVTPTWSAPTWREPTWKEPS